MYSPRIFRTPLRWCNINTYSKHSRAVDKPLVHRLDKVPYENTKASVQIKRPFARPIPIRKSVRKGWPAEYVPLRTVSPPLLCVLEDKLPGITVEQRARRTTLVAYADDVTVSWPGQETSTPYSVPYNYTANQRGLTSTRRNQKHSPSCNGWYRQPSCGSCSIRTSKSGCHLKNYYWKLHKG